VAVAELPRLGGDPPRITATGGGPAATYTLPGPLLQQSLRELLNWAADRRLELAGLQVRSASLEDVFLRIAGRPAAEEARR